MNAVPSIRRRLTGSALRRYRESLGYHLDNAAGPHPRLRPLENLPDRDSARGIRLAEIRILLTEYGAGQQVQVECPELPGQSSIMMMRIETSRPVATVVKRVRCPDNSLHFYQEQWRGADADDGDQRRC